MKDLLDYLIKSILGDEEYEIVENSEGGRTDYVVKVDPKNVGLIIGKGGRMIKALRNIIKVKATLEKTAVTLNVE